MNENKGFTGYPSIDKPWLKYYSEDVINAKLPECTLYEYLYENNKSYPSQYALNYFGKRITYGELFKNIDKAAKAFQAMGIKEGDIVTIMAMHTPEVIYCMYALNRLGAVANMVYMTLSEKELLHEIKNTESKALVVLNLAFTKVEKIYSELNVKNIIVVSPADSMKFVLKTGYKLKTKQPKLGNNYLSYDEFIKLGKSEYKIEGVEFERNRFAIIAHTSGTTGEPKGVMLSNYNLNALAHQYRNSGMTFERGDTFFNMLPPFIGFGISVGMHLPLALGMEEILWILPDSEKVADGFIKHKPKHFVSTPTNIEKIVMRMKESMDFVITFAGGGESVTIEKEEKINQFIREYGGTTKFVTGYGMTEFGATVCTGMNHVYKAGSLGIPLPAVDIKIVDMETGEELGYNQVGEMCFYSPNTMIGYYKNQNATNEIIKIHKDGKRWLHTGDLGKVDEDGFVYFEGRTKRIFLTRGNDGVQLKIFPQRVEDLFSNNEKVKACGVVAIPDEERINKFIAFVTKREEKEDNAEIKKDLFVLAQNELPEHSMPEKIVVLKQMPLTQSGKIDYRALEDMC